MRMLILRLLSRRGFAVRATALVVLGALAACNLSVDNPDRVQDPLLNDPGAHAAVVAGASLAVSKAINWVAFFAADASKKFRRAGGIPQLRLRPHPGRPSVQRFPTVP